MKTVVAVSLAKKAPQELNFFAALHSGFAQQGVAFHLFSTHNDDKLRSFRKPFSWAIGELAEQYPLAEARLIHRLTPEQREKWRIRVAHLALQRPGDSPERMVEILERFGNHVLQTLSPDVVLSWNTLCPHSGVLADLARSLGIKVYLIERAFLTDAWFLESGGLVGHSELVDRSLEELLGEEEEDCRLIGESYLGVDPFRTMDRHPQNQNPKFHGILAASRKARRPVLGFFPPDDLSLGFLPPEGEDRRKHIPGYESSIAAAIALAEAAPHCDVIFKPHPSFLEMNLPEKLRDNLYVVDHDYREVMAEAEVMVSTGTGLVANALALGKPVLQMNRDHFLNKGITYEALSAAEIPAALEAALAKRDLPRRLERYRLFIGYCLRRYLISPQDADAAFRRPADAVREIVRENFGRPSPQPQPRGAANLSSDRLEMLQALRSETEATLLVDFDHTLLFGNTTELFLERVRPKFLFLAVHWMLTWLTPWARLATQNVKKDQIFDPWRVFLAALLAPWSLWLWRRRAPDLARRLGNHALIETLRRAGPERVVVVSNGHPWLLRPLVRAMGLGKAQLVCGDVVPGPEDIRRIGKIAACSRQLKNFNPAKAIAVSDSLDDLQMLTRSSRGFLIDWRDAKTKADPYGAYFPFVLTTEGKYPGARVVRRHRFQEDFPVIFFAFALSGIGLQSLQALAAAPLETLGALTAAILGKTAALFLLFLSFNAVYEIGYWDNDFVAAAAEETPNVSQAMRRFEHYPIRSSAWRWGAVCGLLGTLAISLGGYGYSLGIFSGAAGFLTDWAVSFLIWMAGLKVMRLVFDAHNTLPELARIYSFYALHALKLLAYALVLPLQISGVILAMSQIYRHWLGYAIYRFQGRKNEVPRLQVRGFFFVLISAMFLLAVPTPELIDLTWLCGLWFFLAGPDGFRLPRRRKAEEKPEA